VKHKPVTKAAGTTRLYLRNASKAALPARQTGSRSPDDEEGRQQLPAEGCAGALALGANPYAAPDRHLISGLNQVGKTVLTSVHSYAIRLW
jgi:hypothetical protein